MDRRQFLISAGATLAGAAAAQAQPAGAPEKAKVTLGVGGKPLLYYLPLTIAERGACSRLKAWRSKSTISAAARNRCRR